MKKSNCVLCSKEIFVKEMGLRYCDECKSIEEEKGWIFNKEPLENVKEMLFAARRTRKIDE